MDTLPLIRANLKIVKDAEAFLSGMLTHLLFPSEYKARTECIRRLEKMRRSIEENITMTEKARKTHKKEAIK